MTIRATHRWDGVAAVAFLSAGAGVVAGRPALLLVGVVGIAYAAYARITSVPEPALDVERELSEAEPAPGEDVRVTVTVRNAGGLLPDLRLVDGVPDSLAIVDGSPRHGTALRSGKTATFRYSVRAERGRHEFPPLTVVARDASGAFERETTVDVPTTIRCVPPLVEATMDVPLRAQTAQYTGPVPTAVGGSGIEFFATRKYRPGDAMTHIDWHRLARTGELSTVEYREERMATVVLVIDARDEAYRGTPGHALDRSVDAAGRMATALLDAGHRVGVSAVGSESCWLAPNTGEAHRAAIQHLLAMHPALAPTPPAEPVIVTQRVRELRRRLPSNAQLVLVTPLGDDYIVTVAGRLEAYGHALSVVSPDPTRDGSSGRTLARIERQLRIDRLRSNHVPVIDWGDEQLERAIAAAREKR